MRQQDQRWRWLEALAAVVLGLGFAMQAAHAECVSPSAAEGVTTTTVYRCPEQQQQPTAKSSPLIVDPGKATVVERGSADVPWFEPKPTRTEDPIETETAKQPVEKPSEVSQKPVDKPAQLPKTPQDEAADPVEAAPAAAQAAEAKPVKPKTVKSERRKAKLAKSKRTKTKVAKKPKRAKTKLAKTKRSTTTADTPAKSEAASAKETAKAEPAKSDDKVIVWTKKDMPLGNRIKNWLGL